MDLPSGFLQAQNSHSLCISCLFFGTWCGVYNNNNNNTNCENRNMAEKASPEQYSPNEELSLSQSIPLQSDKLQAELEVKLDKAG